MWLDHARSDLLSFMPMGLRGRSIQSYGRDRDRLACHDPPAWLDPAEAPPQVGTFELYYALHDALVRPLPGEKLGHSLAESWTESLDGLVYEFKLREGLRFHNGDPCTAEDVKFSFERYRGVGAKPLHAHVQTVEVVDALRVRFHLHAPWPDFLTFYGTTAQPPGSCCPNAIWSRWGRTGSKNIPSAWAHTCLCGIRPGSRWCWRAMQGTGARCLR